MNIYTAIQEVITALSQDVNIVVFDDARDELEELEYTTPIILIASDWTSKTSYQNFQLIKEYIYNLEFKKRDEWDNSDIDTAKSYTQTSIDIVEEMTILADSVLACISASPNYNFIEPFTWSSPAPILRENTGTMTGIKVRVTIKEYGTKICP